ncbi:hypothetical protein cyc_06018 [Cyclospora cayetanensis]|uniref:Uncharacterized protein n=1 Tax=Cyclospora cayetanensis TaxID=88456 RepID=A0A1D3D0B0_9EIME|nr:hypothetical protein cyc_06018 [Cyclospora cayetanensis]
MHSSSFSPRIVRADRQNEFNVCLAKRVCIVFGIASFQRVSVDIAPSPFSLQQVLQVLLRRRLRIVREIRVALAVAAALPDGQKRVLHGATETSSAVRRL